MPVIENLKRAAERLTGWKRPSKEELSQLILVRKPHTFRFGPDAVAPNHPMWPLTLYRKPVRLPDEFDPAAVLEDLFASNGWKDSWRNGIYDYLHYHSSIHEALGIARGHAEVRFGGNSGKLITLRAGDVAILPAGTGHQLISSSDDLLVVGAYPEIGVYDLCTRADQFAQSAKNIKLAARPKTDPVFGKRQGRLPDIWKKG